MNRQLWQKARVVFAGALARTPDQWSRFVDQTCNDDRTLKNQVELLLHSHQAANSFLQAPVTEPTASPPTLDRASQVGELIGPYRVVRLLGQGGMGAVYLAVRADEEFQQRVALKLLKPGMDSAEVLRRFRTERQILAALDHPNIAKLFDGGTTDDGRPYFVMDYVEGLPIDAYCDAHDLSISERLELFRTVCSAVSYAHRNLIVHRDLKPSNILVNADGIPKLLDFGIAKLLNPELSRPALEPTATALRLMTPDFASPEQVRGTHITTATDVYSLGVLLYQLLTGHLPHRFKSRSAHEIVHAICDQVPEPPSVVAQRRPVNEPSATATTTQAIGGLNRKRRNARRLVRRLSGDVDNIVLMALRKEPARRYDSVDHFAGDVRRHLEGMPILARKDTLMYRGWKFMRRHQFGVAALAILFMVVIGASIALGLQQRKLFQERDRVAAERDLAHTERQRVEQVMAFLIGLFEVSDPLTGKDANLDIRTVLDQGADRLTTELRDQPEVRAELLEKVGAIYQRLGLFDRAAPLLEIAVADRERVHGDRHESVANSLNLLAELRLARGAFLEARRLFQQALSIRRELLGPRSAAVAETLNDLGKTFHYKGDLQAAETHYRQAFEIRVETLGESHVEVAETLNNLATVLWQKGAYSAAEPLHRRALDLRRRLLGRQHVEVSESLNNLATLLTDQGQLDEAQKLFEEALTLRRRRLGDDHPRVATTLHNLAGVVQLKGDLGAAESLNRQALASYRRARGSQHRSVARSASQLASVLERRDKFEEAETLHLEAVAILRDSFSEPHPWLGQSLSQLAAFRARQGSVANAEALAREALEILQRTLPRNHWRTAVAESVLGSCLSKLGQLTPAEPHLTRSHDILSQAPSKRAEPYLQDARQYLAELHGT